MQKIAVQGDWTLWAESDDPQANAEIRDGKGNVTKTGKAGQLAKFGVWESAAQVEERATLAAQQENGPKVSIEVAADIMMRVVTGEWTFEDGLAVLRDAANEGL